MVDFEEVIYNNLGNSNDYSLYDKSYVKKSKKILSNLEESRSKSNSRVLNQSRDVSPGSKAFSNSKNDYLDAKKYVLHKIIL